MPIHSCIHLYVHFTEKPLINGAVFPTCRCKCIVVSTRVLLNFRSFRTCTHTHTQHNTASSICRYTESLRPLYNTQNIFERSCTGTHLCWHPHTSVRPASHWDMYLLKKRADLMHYVWLHTHIQKCVFTLTPSLLYHCLSVVVWRENKKFMRLFILEDKAWTPDKRQTETDRDIYW